MVPIAIGIIALHLPAREATAEQAGINNWNENRKEKTQIKAYLLGLIEAVEEDINYLNYTIQGNNFRANCINTIIHWSHGSPSKSIAELKYEVDNDWNSESLNVGWTNDWIASTPKEYDLEYVEECFLRTSFGNIIVTNQFNIEEFKNSGLFSNIKSEELRKQINQYYAMMNWAFSLWRETNYREKIDNWESFLRNNYQSNYSDISNLKEPLIFLRDHRDVKLELESLGIDAAGRVNTAGEIRQAAKELIISINNHLQ